MLTIAAVAAGCGRSAESKAAERAQDACIGALTPVADSRAPSVKVLDEAVEDARAAADVDPDRWAVLRDRVEAVAVRRGTSSFEGALAALVTECDRVNEVVRSGGKEPPGA